MTSGLVRNNGPSIRGTHIPLFDVGVTPKGTIITYAGEPYIRFKNNSKLPRGFHERLVKHIFDLLVARRTALWDEQAVYGEEPIDWSYVRANADKQAAENMRRIEAAIK